MCIYYIEGDNERARDKEREREREGESGAAHDHRMVGFTSNRYLTDIFDIIIILFYFKLLQTNYYGCGHVDGRRVDGRFVRQCANT